MDPQKKSVPVLNGEELYVPFVGAIIENENADQKQILIQVRQKASDKVYDGSYEIPGGKFSAFEDIYESLRREVKEESGLTLSFITGEKERIDCPNRGHTSTLIDPFCVTQTKEGPFIGIIFLCKAAGTPLQLTNETKEARWIEVTELKKIIGETPELFYTPFLAPLKKYLGII